MISMGDSMAFNVWYSAFLDARFKSLHFLKPEEKDDVATGIVEEIVHITPADTEDQDARTTPKPKRHRGEHVLLEILSDVFKPLVTDEDVTVDDNSDSNHPTRLQASLEIKAYLRFKERNN